MIVAGHTVTKSLFQGYVDNLYCCV